MDDVDMAATTQGLSKPKVAFLGPYASYTHQATKSIFSEETYGLSPTVTIKEIFDVVQSGQANLGVVPFENSTHGPVIFTLEALADRQGVYKDIQVKGEIYLDVHHCLLGRHHQSDSSSLPLQYLTRIYSHPQAFGQTQRWVAAHLPGIECLETSSTSKAAELAAADASGTSAAIAGEIAAASRGLDVLARNIEDRDDNTTRFFIITGSKGKELGAEEKQAAAQDTQKCKSLLRFTVPHEAPGALADVLDCFRRSGLNLTSINSLPSFERPFHYLFFVEVEGIVLEVLDEVEKVAQSVSFLGYWPKAGSSKHVEPDRA